jgi:hypothetical protein
VGFPFERLRERRQQLALIGGRCGDGLISDPAKW